MIGSLLAGRTCVVHKERQERVVKDREAKCSHLLPSFAVAVLFFFASKTQRYTPIPVQAMVAFTGDDAIN